MTDLSPESKRLFALTREAMSPDANEIAALRETLVTQLQHAPAPLGRLAPGAAAKLALTLAGTFLIAAGAIWSSDLGPTLPPTELSAPQVRPVSPAPEPSAPTTQRADEAQIVAAAPASATRPARGKRRPRSPAVASRAPSAPEARSEGAGEPQDALGSELALLRAARAALERHEPATALSWLEQHAQRFPYGTLRQERLASRARALCALERRSEARAAARELAREVPGSPYLAALNCSEGD